MDPAPNNNHHEPKEEGCELCGFMMPHFPDYENVDCTPREPQGTAEGGGSSTYNNPTFRQQEPIRYENRASSRFNIEDIGPMRLQEELKRLFPETRNPG
jgi:hypothetical protein